MLRIGKGSACLHALIDVFLDYIALECGLSANTLAAYGADLKRFFSFLGQRGVISIHSVTRELVLDYLHQERERGLSVHSVSRHFVSIRVLFRFLQRENYLAHNVLAVMDTPRLWKLLPGTLSEHEVERLLAAPVGDSRYAARDRTLLHLMYATGLRVSEITRLTLEDVHMDSDYIRCLGKGNKVRVVPFGTPTDRLLRRYLSGIRPRFVRDPSQRTVFLTRLGGGFSRKTVWSLIKDHAAAAGIDKPVSPHTLRHSFASHLLAHGASLRIIQEMLGHADIATTEVYTHVDASQLKGVHHRFHPRG